MKVETAIEAGIWGHFLFNLTDLAFPIAQAESLGFFQPFMELLKEFGGLGLAIWLAWWHTTKTIPRMQQEAKEDRQELYEQHRSEMERSKLQHSEEIKQLQETFKESIQRATCQYRSP